MIVHPAVYFQCDGGVCLEGSLTVAEVLGYLPLHAAAYLHCCINDEGDDHDRYDVLRVYILIYVHRAGIAWRRTPG